MAREQPIELFMPPNMLKAKVGGGAFTGLDMAAIRRGEAAMEEIKSEFAGWAAQDVEKLMAARARFAQTPDAPSRAALLRAAHDMKGQAATFNYPMIARVSGSLSRLVGEWPANKELDESNKLAVVLSNELEKQVTATLKS
jgi:chemotaxis protein histidine kinase CheA